MRSNPYYFTDEEEMVFDVYQLFEYYNNEFFSNMLVKCTVKWTNRMTVCAGTCKYEGFGSSTIALSQPILKFRSPNQIKETLLHQMIHAYLFMVDPQSCKVEEGHGPKFKQIMHSINQITNLNISVYHSFHDEVELYRKHIWRCNGRCRQTPPFYGYVKRSNNRKPQPADRWFNNHQRVCGGEFIKIASPNSHSNDSNQDKSQGKNQQKVVKPRKKKESKKVNWGTGKTIQQYVKQMSQKSKDKSTETKGKSIQDYVKEIEQEKKLENKNKDNQ